jgi:hypothetical protein
VREERSKSRSLSLVREQSGRGKGRRAAGMAFMALGIVGTWSRMSGGGPRALEGLSEGQVIPRFSAGAYPREIRQPQPSLFSSSSSSSSYGLLPHITTILVERDHEGPPHPPEGPPNLQRIVGRISAWSCTTLYLTSRLPQIWKNVSWADS